MKCLVCSSITIKFFVRKNNCDIFECGSCGLLFVYPTTVDAAMVYSEDYFGGAKGGFGYVDYDADKEPMILTFMRYLRLIRSYVPAGKKLLDVGAASGFFIDLAQKDGWQVKGVEVSEHAAALGRKKGLDVVTGTLQSLPKEVSFDAITMLDLIEHVENPHQELAAAHALLSEGGILVINTPDAGSNVARIFGKRWHLIVPPEHLYYFNRRNIVTLLEKAGFDTLLLTTIGKQFTLQYIFKMLYKWQGLSLWKRLSFLFRRGALSRISISLNTRDNMFIIARKK